MKDEDETLLTTREAAERLNVSVRTIYRLVRKGEIPARKFGRHWRVPASALRIDAAETQQGAAKAA